MKRIGMACALLPVVVILCVGMGSVSIPIMDTLTAMICALTGRAVPEGIAAGIILQVRLPRVVNVALTGAALSVCGAAMQGLLRNPLADGSTLGVSSGAALGAVIALLLGAQGAVSGFAMLFAFLSLAALLSLSYALDRSLSTGSIILIGVIFSMFMSSFISLLTAFAGDRLRAITFWTMGSLSGTGYAQAGQLALSLLVFGGVLLRHARELDAFAIGEDNARHIGVDVRRVKLVILIAVSALIGVCVSVGGTIGFVGLIIPHMARMLVGPKHGKLLPMSLFLGADFLLLCDLAARTLLSPVELPIGVITSMLGAGAFIFIFCKTRRAAR